MYAAFLALFLPGFAKFTDKNNMCKFRQRLVLNCSLLNLHQVLSVFLLSGDVSGHTNKGTHDLQISSRC